MTTRRSARGAILWTTVFGALSGCTTSAGGARGDGAAGASAAGAGEAGAGGTGTGATGSSGMSGGGAGAQNEGGAGGALAGHGGGAGSGGAGTGAAGNIGVAGAGGGTAGAAGGAAGTGAAGQGVLTTGTAGGMFVMCDDHADFNGRGLCSPTGKFGAVIATQTLSTSGATTTLTAAFGPSKPASDPGCTQTAVGAACVAVTCPAGAGRAAAGAEAGAITAKSSGGTLVTKPDATGAYGTAGFASALWTMPKAALAFAAAGGAIPAFGETFCGPASATLTAPSEAPGAALTIDRASDLTLQWTGGAVGELQFVARDANAAGGASLELRCSFTGSAGQGVVPKAGLAQLGAGTHKVSSSMWVRKIGLGSGTCVELTGVVTNLSAAGGVPFNGAATFQ